MLWLQPRSGLRRQTCARLVFPSGGEPEEHTDCYMQHEVGLNEDLQRCVGTDKMPRRVFGSKRSEGRGNVVRSSFLVEALFELIFKDKSDLREVIPGGWTCYPKNQICLEGREVKKQEQVNGTILLHCSAGQHWTCNVGTWIWPQCCRPW